MKIAIIGGGGVRTPLLVNGLAHSDLPIAEISLYDTDVERLAVIAAVADRVRGAVEVRRCSSSADCVTGADYVFISIRVGGIATRARDEAVATGHGIAGQETVGPGGFAMAMRTIPHVLRYAREVERLAPLAWMINFTNPVGIVTEAVRTQTSTRIIGICDTPTELFEEVAGALGVSADECHFDYFGLNHLGWLREVFHRGVPQLRRLWSAPERLMHVYRTPLFDIDFLQELQLLPTEYLFYYYRPREALANLRRAGQTRGQVLERLNDRLFEDLRAAEADPVEVYRTYLATRDAGYMQIESGTGSPRAPAPEGTLTGYDKIALSVVRAIHFNSGRVIPLDVRNGGSIPDLEADDVVEIPCVVNANGPLPLHVGKIPVQARDLLLQVKAYERLTAEAAVTGSDQLACRALAANPLVGDLDLAQRLVEALGPLW